jgi:hypothetical protein
MEFGCDVVILEKTENTPAPMVNFHFYVFIRKDGRYDKRPNGSKNK